MSRKGKNGMKALAATMGLVFLLGMSGISFATDVSIWDNTTTSWTTTFANGDPIDKGTAHDANNPQIAVDSNGVVYAVYSQSDGSQTHIYLSRYDGTDVRIWDNDTTSWTTTFADGDPIDTGTENGASDPQLAIDSSDRVYVAYRQYDESEHIYLSRYDGTDVRIWDNDASTWTTTFADGDPIDKGTNSNAYAPQIAIDSSDRVYVAYRQHDDDNSKYHIHLSRYDGEDVKIWDNGASEWTDTFADGDPIDTGTDNSAYSPQLAIDSSDRVYVTYHQTDQTIVSI